MKNHKNMAILSLCFTCLHMVFNHYYYGNHFFMRSLDFYFMNGLEDAVNFRKDINFFSTEFSPYLLFHRSILFGKNLFGFSLHNLMWFIYFFANWGSMNAYLYFSDAMFGDNKVSLLFLGLLALNFAPWTVGSSFGLSTAVIAPNMIAIIFQVLAIASFLRTDRIILTAIFLSIAFYFHSISTLFLFFAIFFFILWKRETFKAKELYLSLLTLSLLLLPQIIWMADYLLHNFKSVQLDAWQLDAHRHSLAGHISLSLIWANAKVYHLLFYFIGLVGFILILFKYGNKLSSPDKIEKVKFITATMLCSAVFFSLTSDLYLKFMTLQALKSTLWFVQLFIGIFIIKVISDVLFSAEHYKSKLFFIFYLYSITILCATFKLMEDYNVYLKVSIFFILFATYFFRENLSFLLKQFSASKKILQTKGSLVLSFLLIVVSLLLYQKWIFFEKSQELYSTDTGYDLHNKNWDDVMASANKLPTNAYILYPFYISSSYYARAKRPGFFNYGYIAALYTGTSEIKQVTIFLADLFNIKDSFNRDSLANAWSTLTKKQILKIKNRFKLTHLIYENSKEFDFPVIYKNKEYTLYLISN
ncbi:MAG: hypothetical protein KKI12_08480 [Proteobacteria bacterium]|nr:hypothetical protein [Pseudomonadota bacterium]MBU4288189.1 hypothetical protein [Pseudomonadota bacterium]MBU4415089.1 hypothetical protein [Pseudomonadota bacterium]MCG2757754.1 hypothetical protein [Desulfobacteraceae bacterium]